MSEVKKYNAYAEGLTVHFELDSEGAWVAADDYDAQRLLADTSEAELKIVRKSRDDELENYNALIADYAAAEQRIASMAKDLELARDKIVSGLVLLRCDDQFIQKETAFIDAALNPEAVCRNHTYRLGECTHCGCISPAE